MGFYVSERSQRRFALRMPRVTRPRLLGAAAFLLGGAITVNATLLQSERHPAPMFRTLAEPAAADAHSSPHASHHGEAARAAEALKVERTASLPASDPLLRDLQTELAARGYYKGDPNGRIDPATTAAIRDFQSDQRMTVDGLPSESLLAEIRSMRETVKEELYDLVRRANAPERGDRPALRRFETVKPARSGDVQPAHFAHIEPRAGLEDKPRPGPERLAPAKESPRKDAARKDDTKSVPPMKRAAPAAATGKSPPSKVAATQAGSKPVREAKAEPKKRVEIKKRIEIKGRIEPKGRVEPERKAVARIAPAVQTPVRPSRLDVNAPIRPPANVAEAAPRR